MPCLFPLCRLMRSMMWRALVALSHHSSSSLQPGAISLQRSSQLALRAPSLEPTLRRSGSRVGCLPWGDERSMCLESGRERNELLGTLNRLSKKSTPDGMPRCPSLHRCTERAIVSPVSERKQRRRLSQVVRPPMKPGGRGLALFGAVHVKRAR